MSILKIIIRFQYDRPTFRLNNSLFPLYPCAYVHISYSPPVSSFLPSFVLFRGWQFVARREVEFSRMPARMGLARREAVIRNKNASTGGIYAN